MIQQREVDGLTMRRMSVVVAVAMLTACSSGSGGPSGTTTTVPTTAGSTGGSTGNSTGTTGSSTGSISGPSTVPGTAEGAGQQPRGSWRVDVSQCADPVQVAAPITGTLSIVAAAPLSGGVAAAAWKPTMDGFHAYLDYVNFGHLLGPLTLHLDVVDDGYNPDRTVNAIQPLLDKGAKVVAGIAGSDNNMAARFTLNEQCVPQLVGLSPAVELGDVAQYPWTTGALPTAAAEV
ncbi:MAG: ABC transporter substrate-binding protein, partial [Ilumatobacteraceae bacterium]